MKKLKTKIISVLLAICGIITVPTNAFAIPCSEISSPSEGGFRITTTRWDCIPIKIGLAKNALAKIERYIEKVGVATGFLGLAGKWYPELPVSGAISTAVLVAEKHNLQDTIDKMEECYRNHQGIKFKTKLYSRKGKMVYKIYRWLGTF